MKSALLVVIMMHSCVLPPASAQSAMPMVRCSMSDVDDCSSINTAMTVEIPYSTCCSMIRAADRHYLDESGVCSRCGPILDETFTVPTLSTSNCLTLSWRLAASSVISPTNFTVVAEEFGGPSNQATTVEGDAREVTFQDLVEGLLYTYSVRGIGENGGISPAVEVRWFTGRDLGPTFSDFMATSVSANQVSAEWTLTFNGLSPLLTMTLIWQDDIMRNQANKTVLLTEEMPDGSRFDCTFEDLLPETRYSLQIVASNEMHATSSFFTFDTNSSVTVLPPPSQGLLNHAASATSVPIVYLMLLTLLP